MEAHELLERHTGTGVERRHDSRVAADKPDTRWCSDGFEIGCNNSEPAQSRTTGKNQFCQVIRTTTSSVQNERVGGRGKSAMASRMTPC
jgi:hypothetical protein